MFDKFFMDTCFYESKCSFDIKEIGYKLGEIDSQGNRVTENSIGLFGLISDECKLRMSYEEYLNITSPTYVSIVGCRYDDVKFTFSENRVHKEKIGVVAVALDFASILVMIFFFSKIKAVNDEFSNKIDDLRVQMKDFGVILNNIKLDKYSFDSRVIKLKVWLQINELLKDDKDKFNDMKVIDVTLSLYTQPNI